MTSPLEPVHLPQGACVQPDGGVLFRVWAPLATRPAIIIGIGDSKVRAPLLEREGGYFEALVSDAHEGTRYAYELGRGAPRPDPASRWQPDGVHHPSAVFDSSLFPWTDSGWRGCERRDLVIYELHVGTFTPEGTFAAVIPRLAALRDLGITAIEIMPVSQFSGTRNWGYDGVHLHAPQNSYGGPRGLQELVNAAHEAGIAVLLDVVYNHFGPEGNYLAEFGPYFNDRYHTPWGAAVNYDGRDCDPVRQFVIDNARAWIRDFHLDGLRLDAIQMIMDSSARHILVDVRAAAHEEGRAAGRTVHVIGETDQNDARLTAAPEQGGVGLDAVWSDDLHHTLHACLTGERDGYYVDFGAPEQIARALTDSFVFDGRYSRYRRRRYGSSVRRQDASRFIVCLQNHDQTGNRARGERIDQLVDPAARRLAAALVLLAPGTPLLFMGEEYGERASFPFFCSFSDHGLIQSVREGRRREFRELAFDWLHEIPDPQDPATFELARLTWKFPPDSAEGKLRALYRDLLRLRREWRPVLTRENISATVRAATDDSAPEVLQAGYAGGIALVANLSAIAATNPLSPTAGLLLSTALSKYGGPREDSDDRGRLHPHEVLVFRDPGEGPPPTRPAAS